jgi:CHAD domain-containing protein
MTRSARALQAPGGARLSLVEIVDALSVEFSVANGAKTVVRRAQLDTFDRRLSAAALALEYLTLASGQRLVLRQVDGSVLVTATTTNLKWPAMADDLSAGPIRDAVEPIVGVRALTVITRESRIIRSLDLHNSDSKTVARLEFDEPAADVNGTVTRPPMATVLALRGYDQEARLAARLLTGIGLQEARPETVRSASPRVRTDRSSPAIELLTLGLRGYLVTMRENLPGLLDDVDTEFLHDFRVAVRRTRTTLMLGRPCIPGSARDRWEPAFKDLGKLTTPVRDLDVYELGLPMMTSWLVAASPRDLDPFAHYLRRHRTAERRILTRQLRSAKVQRLFADWDEALTQMVSPPTEPLSAGVLADRSIGRAYRRVLQRGQAISPESPAEDLHTLRKDCKNLRYALEVYSPVLAKGPRKRAVQTLKGLQDVLGRFQDSEVQRRALHGFAEEMMADGAPASAVLAMGELIGHLDVEQDVARRQFEDAFAQFAQRTNQQMMRNLGRRK